MYLERPCKDASWCTISMEFPIADSDILTVLLEKIKNTRLECIYVGTILYAKDWNNL